MAIGEMESWVWLKNGVLMGVMWMVLEAGGKLELGRDEEEGDSAELV